VSALGWKNAPSASRLRLQAFLIAAGSKIAGRVPGRARTEPAVVEIPNLEIHAWHGCNLSCESCAHYSSLGVRGGPTAEMCESWMQLWAPRLRPRVFSIVGGEPTLNRHLARIVQSAASAWPHSEIRVVTNGFQLGRHPDLPLIMSKLRGRAFLEISSHHSSEDFRARFRPVRELAERWAEAGVDVRITPSDENWTRRYAMNGSQIEFLDGDPRAAWEACIGKKCPQIYLGMLWKCPPIAYLDLLPARIHVEPAWRTLAGSYRPLLADCSDADLAAFLCREEENVCRLCPSQLERFELPNPLVPTRRKSSSRRAPAKSAHSCQPDA